jgi:hypothetical protein
VKQLATILVVAALLAAPEARAQGAELASKWGSVEVGAGPYVPNLDSEFHGTRTPYRDIFGGSPAPMWRIHVGRALFTRFGTLEAGFRTGFWSKSGRALDDLGNRTGDRARISIVPTSLTLTYRADMIWERMNVPLVPYGRFTLERYNWWTSKEGKWTKLGATNGWSATAGVVLIIDWLDPEVARDAANEVGIAHTGLYVDLTKSKVDDFGSKKSWDMSADNKFFWSGGLLVVF